MRKLRLVCVLVPVAFGFATASAPALGADPSSNFAPAPRCSGAVACLARGIQVLDEARGRLGQPPYALPNDFASLTPGEQAFVLTNLDRILEGLRPIPGLTSELDQAAAAGVRSASDPLISGQSFLTLESDWAGGYPNMPFAYEGWMYDDGPGGANLDCTASNRSGCWGHRRAILWPFDGTEPLAMGAAAGTGPTGVPGASLVLMQGSSSYRPAYLYTWSEAVAAGAGSADGSVLAGQTALRVRPFEIVGLHVRGHALRFRLVAAQPIRFTCVLRRLGADHLLRGHVRSCGAHTRYRALHRGSYWLEVHGAGRTLTRDVRVTA